MSANKEVRWHVTSQGSISRAHLGRRHGGHPHRLHRGPGCHHHVHPTADTYVDNAATGTNYGTSGQLGIDNSSIKRTFLRFSVSGLSGAVSNAKLRIHTDDVADAQSPNGGTFRSMSNVSWAETAVTWNNQPAIDSATLGSLGAVERNAWYEVDVTSYVTGNGTFSIGVTSSNSDGADYDSRESGATTAPQLVITSGTTEPPGDPVLVGAGDIADSGSGDSATAALLDNIQGTVWTTGDNAYPDGTLSQVNTYYEPTWGRHKARTRPSPGNHDYHTSGASGYYSYFGAQAGPSGRGYYSYDLGNWHIVSLNSNISMSAGSAQEQWLRQDLAANTKPCTAAYWRTTRCSPAVPTTRLPRPPGRCSRRCTTTTRTWCSSATTTTTSGSPRRTPTAAWTPRAGSARSSRAWAARALTASARSSRTARPATPAPAAC